MKIWLWIVIFVVVFGITAQIKKSQIESKYMPKNKAPMFDSDALIEEINRGKDSDCACGVHIEKRNCVVGNKDVVNVNMRCPDFCTGIGGDVEVIREEGKCIQRKKL